MWEEAVNTQAECAKGQGYEQVVVQPADSSLGAGAPCKEDEALARSSKSCYHYIKLSESPRHLRKHY